MEIKSTTLTERTRNSSEIGDLVIDLFEKDLSFINKDKIKTLDTKLDESINNVIANTNKVKTLITNIDLAIDKSSTTRKSILQKIIGG